MHVKNYLLVALLALASIQIAQAAPFELSTGAVLPTAPVTGDRIPVARGVTPFAFDLSGVALKTGVVGTINGTSGAFTFAGTGCVVTGTVITCTNTASSGVTTFNARIGAVTLLNADILGALGFTPYNSTNPSGFISAVPVATVAIVGGVKQGSGVTIAADGTLSATGTSGVATFNTRTGAVTLTAADVASALPALTGDVTSPAGSSVTTAVKVNGVAYPITPTIHQVPVVTATGIVTYKTVPDCLDVVGNHLNYTQASDTFTCGATSSGGGGGGGSTIVPVTTVYTASGAIAPTDSLALVNCATPCVMTLANGAINGFPVRIKRYGVGSVTITATIDGTSQNLTWNTGGTMREFAVLRMLTTPVVSYIVE